MLGSGYTNLSYIANLENRNFITNRILDQPEKLDISISDSSPILDDVTRETLTEFC